MNRRETIIRNLGEHPRIPVVILGGGINGIGLLRELALQGVRCLLVDKADFAAGASSKSSRMIHGGLRYLENREFALVQESLRERNRLLANAAHYVTPLRTTIPLYSHFGGMLRSALIFCGFSVRPGERGSFITRLGLMFYDLVTRKDRRTPTHYLTGREQSLREIPGLDPAIVATATYWDAKITQAERLCIELIDDARAANPDCATLNYVAPQCLESGRLILKDLPTGELFTVVPDIVINATGAWVDHTNAILGVKTHFMGGTKGSHLVVDCPHLYQALGDRMVYYQHTDGRVCIVFPFLDKIIMGSTDIPVDDPDTATCDETEIEYMLTTLRGVFPGITITRQQIVFTYCGVRPLPATSTDVTANISRGHTIRILEPDAERPGFVAQASRLCPQASNPAPGTARPFPIYNLIGGKWTTFRALAEQTTDQVLNRLGLQRRQSTTHLPIGGGKDFPANPQQRAEWIKRVSKTCGLREPRVAVLLDRYGTRAEAYAIASEHPLQSLPEYTIEEIQRIAANEQVVHLSDLIHRRSTIALLGRATPDALAELAEVVGAMLGWDAERKRNEIHLATRVAL
ncbi:MAG: glycerol-3-phosphate dehydrogenase/oxidase [Tepidisphaerales bacterium]